MNGSPGRKILVVGTTPDYVKIISERYPGRALFLTDPALRKNAVEESPPPGTEVTVRIIDPDEVWKALKDHLLEHGLELSGVTCYDDESLIVASVLAQRLSLPFHSPDAVRRSRSKFLSKRAWIGEGVPCPRVFTASEPEDLEGVMDRLGFPLVLKPLTGSGSELVFRCRGREEARRAFRTITQRLAVHPDERLYHKSPLRGHSTHPRLDIVAEEGLNGPEFSCEFILSHERVRLVRVGGKIIAPELGTGTALLYYIPANGDTGISQQDLEKQLSAAAKALGFASGLFMADFIIHRGKAWFLELSPRPSGDCLPWLIRASSGVDTLGLAMDVAEGRVPSLPAIESCRFLSALRIFARHPGTIQSLEAERLAGDPRILEIAWYRKPGDRITLPPKDYFSRILGHVIFEPTNLSDLMAEAVSIEDLLNVEIAPHL